MVTGTYSLDRGSDRVGLSACVSSAIFWLGRSQVASAAAASELDCPHAGIPASDTVPKAHFCTMPESRHIEIAEGDT